MATTPEIWKPVKLDFKHDNSSRIEVSNLGRVRSFNRLSDGKILKPAIINGYALMRIKFYSPRAEAVQKRVDNLQKNISKLNAKLKEQKLNKASKTAQAETNASIKKAKLDLNKLSTADVASRVIPYNMLVHRLVATYFCKKSSPKQTVVAHMDFKKLNNKSSNLKWMTKDDNYAHQQKSPLVKKSRGK